MKKSIWFAVAAGAAVLVLIALLAFLVTPVQRVLASGSAGGPPWARMWHGGWGGGSGFTLPPELQGLASIPADQRFDHFTGAQVNIKDKDNNPLTINVIPGKVTASSATSLTITANSGGEKTFTLNNQTVIHGLSATPAPTGTPTAASTALKNGDDVIVVTLNNSTTATAVIASNPAGFGWHGQGH